MNRLNTAWAVMGLVLLMACGAQEPEEPEVRFAKGRQLIDEGAYEEAQKYFEGEIAATPEDPEVHFLAGQAAALGANYPQAEAHIAKAMELQPETSAHFDWLGRIYGAQARIGNLVAQVQAAPKIKENFEKAVELDPNNLEARFFLGTFYIVAPSMAGGDRAKGKAIAEELLTAEPLSGHRLIAQYHVAEGNPDKAEKAYQEALALAPEEPQSHTDLASLYVSQKQIEPAAEHLEKALELDADNQTALMTFGELALRSAEHVERGIEALEKLIALESTIQSPNPGTARLNLALLYEKQGRMDQALSMFEEASELGHPGAAKRLKDMAEAEAEAEAETADEATTPGASTEAPPAEDAEAAEIDAPEESATEAEE